MFNNKGFTRWELVIAILIVGLIAAFAGYLLNSAQKENRDIKTLSDVGMIRNAVEFYFYQCNKYPPVIKTGEPISGADCGGGVYLQSVPPTTKGLAYNYRPCIVGEKNVQCELGLDGAKSYVIEYNLESNEGEIGKGQHYATPEKLY